MPHNENSRVKIPALVHFTRLGYKYISLRKYEGVIDDDTNILVDVLCDAINRINATSLTTTDVQKIVNALKDGHIGNKSTLLYERGTWQSSCEEYPRTLYGWESSRCFALGQSACPAAFASHRHSFSHKHMRISPSRQQNAP